MEILDDIKSAFEEIGFNHDKIASVDSAQLNVDMIRKVRKLRELADNVAGVTEARDKFKKAESTVKEIHEMASMLESSLKKPVQTFLSENPDLIGKIKGVSIRDYASWEIIDYDEVPEYLKIKCEKCSGHGSVIDKKAVSGIVEIMGKEAKIPGIASTKSETIVIRNS